jgi:uracil-DNA glycosylase
MRRSRRWTRNNRCFDALPSRVVRPLNSFTFETWRDAARPLLAARKKAEELPWRELATAGAPAVAQPSGANLRLPRTLMALLENLACFRDDARWELMYRLSWRTLYENPRLLDDPADCDVANASSMDRAVRRDVHKMHAFVRFREVARQEEQPSYFAWFEPQHEILRKGAVFFVERFPNMHWSIATPDGAVIWDMVSLRFVNSDTLGERPRADMHEDLWRTYYRSICNVARINATAMQREMPQHYWRNLPEAAEVATLMRRGGELFAANHKEGDHDNFGAAKSLQQSLANVRTPSAGVQTCRACDIWKHATQAVEGAGPAPAQIMLVGEQPGDEEDLRGAPFVGPAGKVLDEALAAAGLKRAEIYITNAVKHFKWEPRGKRRLHKRPTLSEIRVCNTWLQSEIAAVKPRLIVALGASALTALVGASHSIEAARQMDFTHAGGAKIFATYHPSAILRADDGRRDELRAYLIAALQKAAAFAAR